MTQNGWRALGSVTAALAFVFAVGCTVEQTREGKAPDVDVEGGRLPMYDVNWADVDVGTAERTIEVPVVRVVEETRQVSVPYIDINPPGGRDREERTIALTVDVPHGGYTLQIAEMRVAGDDLWVIGQLNEEGGAPATQAITRVSDHAVVNVPEDLDIRKVIIGARPPGVSNQEYRFVDSMSQLNQQLPQNARTIYQRSGGQQIGN